MIHTVERFSIVNEAEIDFFLIPLIFLCSNGCWQFDLCSAFSKSSLYIWKFLVYVLLKPYLKDFENYHASMWNEHNFYYSLKILLHSPSLELEWKLTFSVLWPLLSFPNLLTYWVQHSNSIIFFCCSVPQSCPTLFNTMDYHTPGFPVLHYLWELAQIHVHWVSDTIQSSCPLLSPSPPAFNLPQH